MIFIFPLNTSELALIPRAVRKFYPYRWIVPLGCWKRLKDVDFRLRPFVGLVAAYVAVEHEVLGSIPRSGKVSLTFSIKGTSVVGTELGLVPSWWY